MMWDDLSKADLRRAKLLIRAGQYDDAIAVLESLPGYPEADELLIRLKRRLYQPKQKNEVIHVPLMAVWIIVFNMLIWSCGVLTITAASPAGAAMTPVVLMALALFWLLLGGYYWLMWRYFWWVLAFSWTAGTLMILITVITSYNVVYQITGAISR